jgi:hypothetical protein
MTARALVTLSTFFLALPAAAAPNKPPPSPSPPPSPAERVDAIATLVAHWQVRPPSVARDTLERSLVPLMEHAATDSAQAGAQVAALTAIIDALEGRGLHTRWLVGADRAKRAEEKRLPCKRGQVEARRLLQLVLVEARGSKLPTEDVRALVAEASSPSVARGENLYRFEVTDTEAGFLVTAKGLGEMAGDEWQVAATSSAPVATKDLCATLVVADIGPRPVTSSTAAPGEDAVLDAIAALSRTIAADDKDDDAALRALSRIALQRIGVDSGQGEHVLDVRRLEALVDQVRARGGRLGAIVAPTLLDVCHDLRASGLQLLTQLLEQEAERPEAEPTLMSAQRNDYVLTRRQGAGRTLRMTVEGQGLMQGDVITRSAPEARKPPPKSDFCAKKAAALARR